MFGNKNTYFAVTYTNEGKFHSLAEMDITGHMVNGALAVSSDSPEVANIFIAGLRQRGYSDIGTVKRDLASVQIYMPSNLTGVITLEIVEAHLKGAALKTVADILRNNQF